MKKVIITGISGFAGSHLAEHLLKKGDYEIGGTYLSSKSLKNLKALENKIDLERIDLAKADGIKSFIKSFKPDLIFHLAALAPPGDSFNDPTYTITNNITAQVNVLEAVRIAELKDTRILVVSSAEVYGMVKKEDLPIDEDTSFRPTNPYAVSKIAQDFLGLQYFLSYGLGIVRVRPFNHIGPRQSPRLVVAAFAKRIAEIEKGKAPPRLPVGNLEARRDFTDVRDTVRAYSLIIENGRAGEVYNLGSGRSQRIEDILQKLLSFAKVKIEVVSDPSLFRPVDTPELVCDNQKIREVIDWKPQIPLDQTLKETLDYWREIV